MSACYKQTTYYCYYFMEGKSVILTLELRAIDLILQRNTSSVRWRQCPRVPAIDNVRGTAGARRALSRL